MGQGASSDRRGVAAGEARVLEVVVEKQEEGWGVEVGDDGVVQWVRQGCRAAKHGLQRGQRVVSLEPAGQDRVRLAVEAQLKVTRHVVHRPAKAVPLGIATDENMLVSAVSPGGPCHASGLAQGMRILSVDARPVVTPKDLETRLHKAGLETVFEACAAPVCAVSDRYAVVTIVKTFRGELLGVDVDEGLRVTSVVDGPAKAAGLRPGMVVLSVNRIRVLTAADGRAAVASAGLIVLLEVALPDTSPHSHLPPLPALYQSAVASGSTVDPTTGRLVRPLDPLRTQSKLTVHAPTRDTRTTRRAHADLEPASSALVQRPDPPSVAQSKHAVRGSTHAGHSEMRVVQLKPSWSAVGQSDAMLAAGTQQPVGAKGGRGEVHEIHVSLNRTVKVSVERATLVEPLGMEITPDLIVASVLPGRAAHRAGLRDGMVVLAVGGQWLCSGGDAVAALRAGGKKGARVVELDVLAEAPDTSFVKEVVGSCATSKLVAQQSQCNASQLDLSEADDASLLEVPSSADTASYSDRAPVDVTAIAASRELCSKNTSSEPAHRVLEKLPLNHPLFMNASKASDLGGECHESLRSVSVLSSQLERHPGKPKGSGALSTKGRLCVSSSLGMHSRCSAKDRRKSCIRVPDAGGEGADETEPRAARRKSCLRVGDDDPPGEANPCFSRRESSYWVAYDDADSGGEACGGLLDETEPMATRATRRQSCLRFGNGEPGVQCRDFDSSTARPSWQGFDYPADRDGDSVNVPQPLATHDAVRRQSCFRFGDDESDVPRKGVDVSAARLSRQGSDCPVDRDGGSGSLLNVPQPAARRQSCFRFGDDEPSGFDSAALPSYPGSGYPVDRDGGSGSLLNVPQPSATRDNMRRQSCFRFGDDEPGGFDSSAARPSYQGSDHPVDRDGGSGSLLNVPQPAARRQSCFQPREDAAPKPIRGSPTRPPCTSEGRAGGSCGKHSVSSHGADSRYLHPTAAHPRKPRRHAPQEEPRLACSDEGSTGGSRRRPRDDDEQTSCQSRESDRWLGPSGEDGGQPSFRTRGGGTLPRETADRSAPAATRWDGSGGGGEKSGHSPGLLGTVRRVVQRRSTAEGLGLELDSDLVVVSVTDGPALAAGLREGMHVVCIDGASPTNLAEAVRAIGEGGLEIAFEVVPFKMRFLNVARDFPDERLGVEIDEDLTVLAVGAGSPAMRSGLRPGMRVVTIDGKPLRNVADLAGAGRLGGKDVVFEVLPKRFAFRKIVREPAGAAVGFTVDADLRVTHVVSGGPACKAGVAPGVTVESVNGAPVSSAGELRGAVVAACREFLLGTSAAPSPRPPAAAYGASVPAYRVAVARSSRRDPFGLVVGACGTISAVSAGSAAARAGLAAGMRVWAVDEADVESAEDWLRAVQDAPETTVLTVTPGWARG
ncbi:hypothetical protein DIPPA_18659 [Diplonema papillatum]|nr:hypothetical protein DIPPA_18659 [Diplonema papillatum]